MRRVSASSLIDSASGSGGLRDLKAVAALCAACSAQGAAQGAAAERRRIARIFDACEGFPQLLPLAKRLAFEERGTVDEFAIKALAELRAARRTVSNLVEAAHALARTAPPHQAEGEPAP